jgi:hypothetical protein
MEQEKLRVREVLNFLRPYSIGEPYLQELVWASIFGFDARVFLF